MRVHVGLVLLAVALVARLCAAKEDLEAVNEEITALIKNNQGRDALEYINRLPIEDQKQKLTQINAARAYMTLGQHGESERILLALHSATEDDREVLLAVAKYYIFMTKYSTAEKFLKKLFLQNEDHIEGLCLVSKVYLLRDKDVARSNSILKRAYELAPNDENVLFELGMLSVMENRFIEAKHYFDRVLDTPNGKISRAYVGKIYLHYQQYESAAVEFVKYLAGKSGNIDKQAIETMLLLAETNDILDRRVEALDLYHEVLRHDPSNALAHGAIGLMLLAVNACGLNHAEAMKHLYKAYELNDQLTPVLDAIKFCQAELAEAKQWRAAIKDAKSIKSSDGRSIGQHFSVRNIISSLVYKVHTVISSTLRAYGICQSFPGIGFVQSLCSMNNRNHPSHVKYMPKKELIKSKINDMRQHWSVRDQSMRRVERVRLDSLDTLLEEYVYANKPVIITNFQGDWNIEKERLITHFGDAMIRVSISESGRFDGPENGKLWGLKEGEDVLVRPPTTGMLFGDFMYLISNASTKETFYLEYLALHQYLGPTFLDLIPLPSMLKNSNSLEHLVTNLWIGGTPTISPLHYDDYENFLCQIKGQKELVLFPPSDMENLYYVGRPKGTMRYEYPGMFTRDVDSIDRRSYVFGSSVNIDNYDAKKYPSYMKAHPIRAVLSPGDVLYLPAFWHHEVQSIPDETEGVNIAVNFWFKNVSMPVDDVSILKLA